MTIDTGTRARAGIPERWRIARASIPTPAATYADVINPARRDEVVGSYARSDRADVERAVAAARRAYPAWRDLGAQVRAALLSEVAAAADALAEQIAPLLTLEIGKTLGESRGDAAGAGHLLREWLSITDDELDLHGSARDGGAAEVRIRRVPLGPVAVISPWNTPVHLAFTAIAPALATGCTVVVKPPEVAPLGLTAMVTELAALLPDGVLSVVPGDGAVAGAALASHPGIRGVFFTGGIDSGRAVLRASSATVKKVTMELGGNDPAIVLGSARITDSLVRELVVGSLGCAGQICFNVKRIYVHRGHFADFVDAYTELAGKIVVGDGFDPEVDIGPLATEDGHRRAARLVRLARDAGAEVRPVGRVAGSARWDDGFYVLPTVVTNIPPEHELVVTEQFCPVVPILPFDDDEWVIDAANATEFGLASSVWSEDLDHAFAVARKIEAGSTFVNVHRLGASVPGAPFGGVKQSGLGRTHAEYSLRACTEEHAIIRFADPASDLPGLARWQHLSHESLRGEHPAGRTAP